MNFAAPKRLRTSKIETDDALAQGGPADRSTRAWRCHSRVIDPAVLLGIVKSVGERHAGYADREAPAEALDFRLRLLLRTALLDLGSLLERRGRLLGDRGRADLVAQLLYLVAQITVLVLQPVKGRLENLLEVGVGLSGRVSQRNEQRDQNVKAMAMDSHARAAPAFPARRRGR